MSKKLKLLVALCIVFGLFAFAAVTAYATATPTSAAIAVTITKDDGTTALGGFTSGCISVKNSADEVLDQGTDYSLSISSNVLTVSGLVYADTYYVSVTTDSATTVTSIVPITALSNTAKAVKMKWSSSNFYSTAKSGVIAGNTVDGNGSVLSGVKVKAYSSDTIYEGTSANTTGAYRIFAPAGNYTLVIVGKDTGTDYKNIYQAITVIKGQASGPITDLNGQTSWGGGTANKLGLTINAFDSYDNSISGSASAGTTVLAFVYNNSNPITYKFLGSAKPTASGTSTTGAYKINLGSYFPNSKIEVRVVDKALNYYEDTTYIDTPTAVNNMTLTADSAATIMTKTTIKFVDATGGSTMSTFLKGDITSVTATCAAGTVNLTGKYTVGAGTITINQGVLSTAQAYGITVKAVGYNDAWISQTIKPSATVADAFASTATATLAKGTVIGSTAVTFAPTVAGTNTLAYKISTSSADKLEYKGNPLTAYSAFTSAADIPNVVKNNQIDIYEIDSTTHAVVKAKRIAVDTTKIKVPVLTSATASATTVYVTCDTNLNATKVPAITAFAVKAGTATKTIATGGVAVSGKLITITLNNTAANQIKSGDTVTLTYTAPTTNPLQEAGGYAAANVTSTTPLSVTNNASAAPTLSSAITTPAANQITLTFSGALAGATGDASSFRVTKGATNTSVSVSSVSVSGTTVTLTLGSPLGHADTNIKVTYTPVTAGSANDLHISTGEKVQAIPATAVTNQL